MGVGHLFSKQFFCDHFHNRLEELANIRISPFYEETWQSWKAKILKIAAQEYPEDSDGAYKAFISSPALVLQRLQLQRYLLTQTHCIGIYKEQLRTPAQDLTFGLYDKDNVRVTSGTGNATTLNCYNLSDEDDLESSVHGVGSFFETVACMQNLDESVEIFEEGALEYMQAAAQRPCPPSALINTDYQVLEGNTAALVTALSKSRSDATYVYCDSATREKQMLYPNHSTPLPYAREGVRGVSINVYGPDDTRGVDLYIPSGKDRYGICLIGMGIQEDALAQAIGRMRGFFNLGQHVKFAFDRHTADKIRAVCRLGDDEPIVSGHVMLYAALNTVQERFLGHTKAFVYQAQQPLRELVHNVLATPLQIPADYEQDVAKSFEREVLFPVFKDYVVETLKTNWAAEYNPHEKLKPVDFMLHLYDAEIAKIEEHCQKLLRETALFAKGLYEEKIGRVLALPLSGALWDAVPLPFKEEMFKNFPKLKILLDGMEEARKELLKRRTLLTEAHPTQGGDSAYKEYVESKLPERITTNSASKVGTQVKQQQQMQQQMQQRQLAQVKTEVEQQMEMHLTVPADGYRQCLNLAQFIEQARPGRSDTHGHYFSLTALAHEYACVCAAATTEIQAMALRMRVPAFLNRATNSNMYISRRAESVFSYTQGQPLPDLYILVIRLSDGSYRSVLITPTEFEELEQLDENEDGVIGFKKLRNLQNYSVSVYSLQNQELSSFPLLHVTSLDDRTTIRENDPVFLNLMVMNHLLLHWTQFSPRQFNFLYDVVDRYPAEAEHLIQALGGDVQSDRVKKLLKTLLKREELTQEDRELYLAFATRKLNQDFPLDDGPYGRYLEIEKACLLHHYRKQPNALKADIVYHQSQSHANSVRCLEELQTAMNLETQRELLLAMLKDCSEGQLEERIRVYISTQPILIRLNDGIRGQFAREVLEQARQQKRVFAIFGKLDQNLALRAYAEIELEEIARWFSNRTLDLQDKMAEHQGNAQSLAVLQEIKTRVCCHHGLQIRGICNGPLEQRLARLSTYFAQLGLSENAEILNFLITEYVLWPRLLELTYTPHRAENHYRLQPLEFNFLCKVLEKYPQAAAHAIETLGSSKERLKAEVETTPAASGRSRAQLAVRYLQIFVKPVTAWQAADIMVFVYFAEDKLIVNFPMTDYSDKELEALYLHYKGVYYRSSLTGITISHTQLDRLHSAQVLQNVEARIAGKEFLEQRKAVVMRELERGSSTSAWLYKTDDEFYKKLDELMVRQGMHMRRGCQETREEIINTCLIKVRAARAMKKLEQNSAREAFTPDEINALAYHTYFSEVTQLEAMRNYHAQYQTSFRVFQDVYEILQDHHRQKMTEECALLRAQGRDDREIQTSLNDYKLVHNLPESWVADLRPVIA